MGYERGREAGAADLFEDSVTLELIVECEHTEATHIGLPLLTVLSHWTGQITTRSHELWLKSSSDCWSMPGTPRYRTDVYLNAYLIRGAVQEHTGIFRHKKTGYKAGFSRFQVFTGTSEIILLVPEAGVEPARPYEPGILSRPAPR